MSYVPIKSRGLDRVIYGHRKEICNSVGFHLDVLRFYDIDFYQSNMEIVQIVPDNVTEGLSRDVS